MPKTILIIEDDKFLREMIAKRLREEGYDVSMAVDGEEGIKKIQGEKPDLILLDLILPGIDGFEVLERMRKDSELAKIPVVILSNLGQKEEVERGRASEFEYEVAKIIIEAGYKVIPQYEVAGYRIDLVVQGENAKLAIECDGDKYHNRIEVWQEDIERQQIIERAGWVFWRLSGSAFYKNGAGALDSLWKKLNELDIKPAL